MTDKEKVAAIIWRVECRIKGFQELANNKDVLETTRISAKFFVDELNSLLDILKKN